MTGRVFVDTNVLVYFHDATSSARQQAADNWLRQLWTKECGCLSFQVLQEFYHVVTRKLTPGLDAAQARSFIRTLLAWNPVIVDAVVIEEAWKLQDQYSLSWWDSLIVSAARASACGYMLTEDLQAGQSYADVMIVDPFRTRPEEIGL